MYELCRFKIINNKESLQNQLTSSIDSTIFPIPTQSPTSVEVFHTELAVNLAMFTSTLHCLVKRSRKGPFKGYE
ncbi:MAG TPA: hypothetical protein VE089_00460 [Nitrososphaeraceae archaeon]|nr:hypothetical protein [Nitrososphaeraceae archaeon]